jgi:hypothetical protein
MKLGVVMTMIPVPLTFFRTLFIATVIFLPFEAFSQWYQDPEEPYVADTLAYPYGSRLLSDGQNGAFFLADYYYEVIAHYDSAGYSTVPGEFQRFIGEIEYIADAGEPILAADHSLIYPAYRCSSYDPWIAYDNRMIKMEMDGSFPWGPIGVEYPLSWKPICGRLIPDAEGGCWYLFDVDFDGIQRAAHYNHNGNLVPPEPIVLDTGGDDCDFAIEDGSGGFYYLTKDNYEGRVRRFDSNGSLVAAKTFRSSDSWIWGLSATRDWRENLLVCWTERDPASDTTLDLYTISLENDLSFFWGDSVRFLAEVESQYQIVPSSFGGFLVEDYPRDMDGSRIWVINEDGIEIYSAHLNGNTDILGISSYLSLYLGTNLQVDGRYEYWVRAVNMMGAIWNHDSVLVATAEEARLSSPRLSCSDGRNGLLFALLQSDGGDPIVGRVTDDGRLGFDGDEDAVPYREVLLPQPFEMHCYPNPFNETLNVQFEHPAELTEIRVFNLLGQVVFRQCWELGLAPGQIRLTLDGEGAGLRTSGVYFISVQGKSGRISERIVYLK